MQISEATLSAVGTTTPIRMLGGNYESGGIADIAAMYTLAPSLCAHLSSGASLTWQWEVTSDQPDASGNWPSPGNWIAYGPVTGFPANASSFQNTTLMFSAVRARILTWTSGSLLLRVIQ